MTATFSSLFVLGAHAQDPPTRVADLNYLVGNVSMQPAGADDWAPAVVNRPFTTGDYLWVDADSRAEMHLNTAAMRLGPQTSVGFLNLDDRLAQIRFAQGELILRVRRLEQDESFEVDTPNAAITILREGEYRFQADPDSATTWVVIRHGEAEITGGGQAFTLRAGNSAQLSGTDQLSYDVQYAPDPDALEVWSEGRDTRSARSVSARYLPPEVIGYEDLDTHGNWRETPDYGAVWYPTVEAGWAPYRDGHWAWIEPWGWTWVDDAPWGFAPSHYGRWSYIGGAWGWIPGPLAIGARGPGVGVVAAVYAPALVAFIGGGSWGVSLSIGGPAVGWVPLGPGEVYAPAYQVSQNYFRTVNVSNTRVVNTVNITNVYNTVYVNKNVTNIAVNQRLVNATAPNAVTAVPQNSFASGRAVKQVAVSVPATQARQLPPASITVAPPVAPVKQALAPTAGSRPAVRPPARVISAPVVAKVAPPPPPVPFAQRQAVLQQNVGKPINIPAIRQAVPARPVATAPVVKVAPPARQVVPQVRPTQAAPPARPNMPGTPATRPPVTPVPGQPSPVTPRPNETMPRPAQPLPVTPRPNETTPRPGQPSPVTPRPNETTPRPGQPSPVTPRPNETTPRPGPPSPVTPRPNETMPRPAQPPTPAPSPNQMPPVNPRQNETTPRPNQPPAVNPRPNETVPRPPTATPRPSETAPRPNETYPRTNPRPNETNPRPEQLPPVNPRPSETTPRPNQPPPATPRPNETYPRPNPRPNETTPRPEPPARENPRPSETTPRPSYPPRETPSPRAVQPPPRQAPPPAEKPPAKSKKETDKKDKEH